MNTTPLKRLKAIFLSATFLASLISWAGKSDSNGTGEVDTRPGSRSVYVANHDSDKKVKFLRLKLRKCECAKTPTDLRVNGIRVCSCWNNALPSDQPAIQGNVGRALVHRNINGNLFPGVQIEQDPQTEETVLTLPAPETLIEILKSSKRDAFIHLVPGTKEADDQTYLSLLAEGKIPVATVPEIQEVKDLSLIYHFYIHDLVNHVWLWSVFPDDLRANIAARAKSLLEVFNEILKKESHNSPVMDLIKLVRFSAVLKFDSAMGNLNNALLNTLTPFVWAVTNNPPIIDGTGARLTSCKMKILIEKTLNFGLELRNSAFPETSDEMVRGMEQPQEFAKFWIGFMILNLTRKIEVYRSSPHQESRSQEFEVMRKDPASFAALQRLSTLTSLELKEIRSNVLARAGASNALVDFEQDSIKPLKTVKEFCLECIENMTHVMEQTPINGTDSIQEPADRPPESK